MHFFTCVMYHHLRLMAIVGHQERATVQQEAEGASRASLQEHSDPHCQAAK